MRPAPRPTLRTFARRADLALSILASYVCATGSIAYTLAADGPVMGMAAATGCLVGHLAGSTLPALRNRHAGLAVLAGGLFVWAASGAPHVQPVGEPAPLGSIAGVVLLWTAALHEGHLQARRAIRAKQSGAPGETAPPQAFALVPALGVAAGLAGGVATGLALAQAPGTPPQSVAATGYLVYAMAVGLCHLAARFLANRAGWLGGGTPATVLDACGPHSLVSACAALSARHGLTEREGDVLPLVARGYTSARIGKELGIAGPTARSHTQAIYRKLGVSGQQGVIAAVERERADPAAGGPRRVEPL